MNIFILDNDVKKAAAYHNDKHCVKMILELAQLMSTAHHVTESPFADKLYKKTHVNHPCAIWVRESESNYLWTYRLFVALCDEYSLRYGRLHKTFSERAGWLAMIPELPNVGQTEFKQCMPDDCKVEGDAVQAYRNYYKLHKSHIATWKTDPPDWWEET